MKHRMTVQYDAKIAFDVNLPHDDARLIREQTPVGVVVDPADDRDDCSKFTLKIRVGADDVAEDYEQASFVHYSAATGAAACLLQYLQAKERLNVFPEVLGPEPLGLHARPGAQTFVAVGWQMSKGEHGHVVAKHGERVERLSGSGVDHATSR